MSGRNEARTPVSRLTDKLFTCDLITFMKARMALTLREEGTRSTYFMSSGKQGSEGIHENKRLTEEGGYCLKEDDGEELSDAMTLNRDLSE